jgi:hypothetical protein
MKIKDKLISAATQFDARNSKRRGWNPYALPQYFAAIDSVCADIEGGLNVETAIRKHTDDRFCDVLLKAVSEEREKV